MRSSTALILAAVSALGVSASPLESRSNVVTLPLQLMVNAMNMKNIVEKGNRKLARYNRVDIASAHSGPATNDDVSYVATVSIGGAPYNLIVDTGSSNTWCGAQGLCEPTSSGNPTGGLVEVMYGSGLFTGLEFTDNVAFGGVTAKSQSIGSALISEGFTGVDGIIGFGPTDLTADTVTNAQTVPTVMDTLYKQGSIPTELLGVSFRPEPGSSDDTTNGELTLGGTDSSRYTGSLTYFPRATSGSNAPYWGITISNFSYGSKSLGGANGIVDTGTTLIYIPSSAYNGFLAATGGTTDLASGLASFTTAPTKNFIVTFGSTEFPLTPSQYLVPQAQYSNFDLTSGKYYSWITSGGSSGVDCIIGQKFLENYYAAFDTTHSRIGFAPGST